MPLLAPAAISSHEAIKTERESLAAAATGAEAGPADGSSSPARPPVPGTTRPTRRSKCGAPLTRGTPSGRTPAPVPPPPAPPPPPPPSRPALESHPSYHHFTSPAWPTLCPGATARAVAWALCLQGSAQAAAAGSLPASNVPATAGRPARIPPCQAQGKCPHLSDACQYARREMPREGWRWGTAPRRFAASPGGDRTSSGAAAAAATLPLTPALLLVSCHAGAFRAQLAGPPGVEGPAKPLGGRPNPPRCPKTRATRPLRRTCPKSANPPKQTG